MNRVTEMQPIETCTITIWMAGDLATTKQALRGYCYERGLCVTVTSTIFIYTGGEEAGVSIGLVNYPRFPSTPESLWDKALEIARMLVPACHQRTALVVGPVLTEWITVEPPGAR